MQFYAAGLNDDQGNEIWGFYGRRRGTQQEISQFIGQHLGHNKIYYSSVLYDFVRKSDESFLDDQFQAVGGAIYEVIQR